MDLIKKINIFLNIWKVKVLNFFMILGSLGNRKWCEVSEGFYEVE